MANKRIKDLATSISNFRSGDYIVVDGTNTAKMPKDDLLLVTAKNAVDSGVAASGYSVKSFSDKEDWIGIPSATPQVITPPASIPAGCKISVMWESEDGISVNIFLKYTDGTQTQISKSSGVITDVVLEKELKQVNYTSYGYPVGVTTADYSGTLLVHALDEDVEILKNSENKINYSVLAYDYSQSFANATASAKDIEINGTIPAGIFLVYGWYSETNAKCVVRLIYTDGSVYQLPTAENGCNYRIALDRDIKGLRFTPYSFPTGVTSIDFDATFKTEGNNDAVNIQEDVKKTSSYNASNKPIVCFVFDDGADADAKIVSWMRPLNLVSTFAIIGNVDPEDVSWKKVISRYTMYEREGHDVICHGRTGGVSIDNIYGVDSVGLGYMNDADSYKVLRTEKEAMRLAGFKTDALCYFNSTRYSPHVLNIVSGEFDFAVGSLAQNNSGVNTPDVTPIALSRNSLDNAGQASVIHDLIEANIDKRVLIIVGTHASSFGGAGKETEENVKSLFAYVAELRDKGLILNMGFHDAVATFYGNRNKILLPKASVLEPDVGQMVINSGTTEICTSAGVKAVFKIEVGGSVSAGSFRVNLKNNRAANSTYTEVTLDGTETIEDVVDILCSKNSYQEVTLIKESSSEIIVRFDMPKVSSVTFSNNTTNLTLTATEITEGVAPTFA